jgi:hypothetical protein
MSAAAQCQMCLWAWSGSTGLAGCDVLNSGDATGEAREVMHHLLWAEAARTPCPFFEERKPPHVAAPHRA